jgi:predicted alpha/beta superfamily hydrolase
VNYFLYLYHELPADRRASKKSQASKIKLIIRVTENAMPKKKKKEEKKKHTSRRNPLLSKEGGHDTSFRPSRTIHGEVPPSHQYHFPSPFGTGGIKII